MRVSAANQALHLGRSALASLGSGRLSILSSLVSILGLLAGRLRVGLVGLALLAISRLSVCLVASFLGCCCVGLVRGSVAGFLAGCVVSIASLVLLAVALRSVGVGLLAISRA